jgi:hypothetical protein
MTGRALLDPHSADRLRKLCGMLGSDHDGERAAAARAADKLVRGLGLTWHQVIAPPIVPDHSLAGRRQRLVPHGAVLSRLAMVAEPARAGVCRVRADLAESHR